MRETFKRYKKKLAMVMLAALCTIMAAVPVLAADGASGTANAAVTDAMSTVAADMVATITAMIPIALTVVGILLAVRAGIKAFRSIAKP